jgi:predicted HNH restriction endonuclease
MTPRKEFEEQSKANEMDNLVALCPPCHGVEENEQTGV